MCKDLYGIKPDLCDSMFQEYEILSKQIFKLALAWSKFLNTRIKQAYQKTSSQN